MIWGKKKQPAKKHTKKNSNRGGRKSGRAHWKGILTGNIEN